MGYALNFDPATFASNGYSWTQDPDDIVGEGMHEDEDYVKQMRANSLIAWCKQLEEEQRTVHELNLRHFQFYSNRYLTSFDWGNNRFTTASMLPVTTTTDNVIVQVVDTLMAKVGSQRPKAKPVLFGASWKKQRQARKLDKFLYGEFIRNDIYEKCKQALMNAFICGFGAIKVGVEDTTIGKHESVKTCLTNIFPDDILIDNTEYNNTGEVYTVAYRRVVPLSVVQNTYPDLDPDQLQRATLSSGSYLSYRTIAEKWVVLVEGYRKAVDGKPGRRMVAIPGVILEDDVWEYNWLPFVFFHWSRPNKTFYTQSVVEQALPNQIRIIDINNVIHRCQEIVSRPRLLVQQGSKVNPLEINNLNAKIIMYTGVKPEALKWDAVPAELYNEREREIKICFDKFGLNQTMANGNLPQGVRLDSSAAVREYNGVQDSRLADPIQRYENFFLDIAKTMIRVIKASGSEPETIWYSGGRKARAEVIHWKDVDLEDDAYTLILEAASSFSMTPSALRDSLEDQLTKGLITPEEYKYQLGAPDSDTLNAVASAGYDDIMRVCDLLEDGKYERPNVDQDLINGVKYIQLRRLALNAYEEEDDDDDENSSLAQVKLAYTQWLIEARAILRKGSEAQVPTQPQPGAVMPNGTPMPPFQPNAASLIA